MTIHSAKTSTPEQEAAFSKWLDQTSEREQARQDRIHGAAGITPTTVWVVLLLSAAIVFVFMLFFADSAELKRSQAMLIGSATTIVVVTLLAIWALDNPYRPGLGNIRPVAMERALVILDEARAALNDEAPIPCDDEGNPAKP
jgi:quinol-cytochrome oxidoreductase complex cytochrome b subunit